MRIRRLGGEIYSRTRGLELSSGLLIAPTWRLNGSVGAERISYESFLGEGTLYAAQAGLNHALGQATRLRVDTGFRREVLDRDIHSWREYIAGVSIRREFPRGFVVTVGPSYRRREYGAPILIYGPEARQDETVVGRIAVSNRHIELFGFMPEITVRHEVGRATWISTTTTAAWWSWRWCGRSSRPRPARDRVAPSGQGQCWGLIPNG